MPRFAASLSMLFREYPFLDRFAEARRCGFDAVELPFPYDDPVGEITSRLARHGLSLALMNTPPPNWAGGPRGFAAMPGAEDRFRSDFRRALRFAGRLRPACIHVMAGKAQGVVARATMVRNLAWAAAEAPGQALTIEPASPADMPGSFLADFETAAGIIAEVGAPNLGLQFDVYHAELITGDAFAAWQEWGRLATHVQVAGVPGRAEPDTGDFDCAAFFARLDADGYAGLVGAEYTPGQRTEDGLAWLARWAR